MSKHRNRENKTETARIHKNSVRFWKEHPEACSWENAQARIYHKKRQMESSKRLNKLNFF